MLWCHDEVNNLTSPLFLACLLVLGMMRWRTGMMMKGGGDVRRWMGKLLFGLPGNPQDGEDGDEVLWWCSFNNIDNVHYVHNVDGLINLQAEPQDTSWCEDQQCWQQVSWAYLLILTMMRLTTWMMMVWCGDAYEEVEILKRHINVYDRFNV